MKLRSFALFSFFLLCILAGVQAQTAVAPAGTGTKANPYQIADLGNLYWLSQNPAEWGASKSYIQTADIDASSTDSWFPNGAGGFYGFPCIGGFSEDVGNFQPGVFYGTYDGQGFSITGLYINRGPDAVGFFGSVWDATIKNITLINPRVFIYRPEGTENRHSGSAILVANGQATISFARIKGGMLTNNGEYAYIGGMLGRMNGVTANDCSIDAVVVSNSDMVGQAGMFVGYTEGATSTYTNCSASGSFTMDKDGQAGGFVGAAAVGDYTFTGCSANVNVNAPAAAAGGFVGMVFGAGININNCYARGSVAGNPSGGFIGTVMGSTGSSITNCYSTGQVVYPSGGGFTGWGFTEISFSGCMYDNITSGKTTGGSFTDITGITGFATSTMQNQTSFTGWDFMGETANGTNDYWFLHTNANNGYPSLKGRTREWVGSAGNAWETAEHWLHGILPDENSIVLLKSAPHVPVPNSNKTVDMISFEGVNLFWHWDNYDLTCNQVLGAGSARHLVFDGTGKLNINIPDGEPRIFPTGLADYTPVTIANITGATDLFSAKVYDGVYKNGGSTGDIVDEAHITHTWDISKASPNAGLGINMHFEWPAGSNSGSMTEPALFHFEDGKWKQQTEGASSYTPQSFTYNNYSGSFSPFSIADIGALILPVRWGTFTAAREKAGALLRWTTGSESGTKDFLVQHSTNQLNWNTIGTVQATGNSTGSIQYTFTHTAPANGINYYRLLQRDLDNNSSLSKIVSLHFEHTDASISIYPNPVTNGKLTVRSSLSGTAQIFNSNGILVLQKNISAGTQEWHLALPSGMYYFRSGDRNIPFLIR